MSRWRERGRIGLRILMLLENSYYPVDTRVSLEATALVKAGYRVSVIAPAMQGQSWHESLRNVSVYRYPIPRSGGTILGYLVEYGVSFFATAALSFWVFLRHGFDVIHAHNPPDFFVLLAASYRLFGKRFVFDHHDLMPEMFASRFATSSDSILYRMLIALERLSCRTADQVIATNESYRAIEMKRCMVPENRITVVRNGPDLRRIRLVAPDRELRERASTIIGYVGAMGPLDGLDCLLRSLAHLTHTLQRHDYLCVLVGPCDDLGALTQLGHQLRISEHLLFTGFQRGKTLLRYLSTPDICVVPDPSNAYNDRSTMIKVMEYMALAKPVVAFDLPEHRFTAEAAALYARPNDELEFARKIAILMDNPEMRAQMGEIGKQRVEQELAWSHQEQHLLDAYGKLMTAPSRRSGLRSPAYDKRATCYGEKIEYSRR